jgi:ferric-dicitrate binding protein FerR (iron transport regulator)
VANHVRAKDAPEEVDVYLGRRVAAGIVKQKMKIFWNPVNKMSKPRKKGQSASRLAAAPVGRRLHRLAAFVIAVAVLAAVGFWWSKGRLAGTPPAVVPKAAATPKAAFEKLTGRWQRPDGGYIIKIRVLNLTGG